MFERVDRLVTKEGFYFQSWDDRYSKGVWAALGTHESEIDVVRDLSSAGDLDMRPAMDYVFSAGGWLPYVTGRNMHEAMSNLETLLAKIPTEQLTRGSDWNTLVNASIDDLRDAYHAGKLKGLITLPRTFEEALSKHRKAVQEPSSGDE